MFLPINAAKMSTHNSPVWQKQNAQLVTKDQRCMLFDKYINNPQASLIRIRIFTINFRVRPPYY